MLIIVPSRTCLLVLAASFLLVSLCNGFYLDEKQRDKVEELHSRSKRSTKDTLRRCHAVNRQGKFNITSEDDCQAYIRCNTGKNKAKEKHCKLGEWFSDTTKQCENVNSFTINHQRECFLKSKAKGTTPNLREVFIGRCLNYKLFHQPKLFVDKNHTDCTILYELFHKAFANKNPCGEVKVGAYDDFLNHAHVNNTETFSYTDKLLFWSGINKFSQEYANGGKRLFTLENTLPGFIINELTWCGQKPVQNNTTSGLDPGINFEVCPMWEICEGHPVVTFWQQASEYFGKIARKQIHLMLDGSNKDKLPFRNNSFFANHELKALESKNVKKVKILLSHRPGVKIQETCDNGTSIAVLKSRLKQKGISFTCEDNPADVLHLLCTDSSDESVCKKRIIPKKTPLFNGTEFGYTVESEGDK